MINLVKNELVKIFHKKGLYILGIFVVIVLALQVISMVYTNTLANNVNDFYFESLEDGLDDYDLNTAEGLNGYVSDKTELEIYYLTKNTDFDSPEYYYIENGGRIYLSDYISSQYDNSSQEEKNEIKKNYDEFLSSIKDFNWKDYVLEEKKRALEEKGMYEEQLKYATDGNEILSLEKQIRALSFQIEGYDYHIKNEIPLSYSNKSLLVDQYVESAVAYDSLDKDESTYSSRGELINKRAIEENYYVTKYQLDHEIYSEDSETVSYNIRSLFSSINFFVLIALLLVFGGVISDEFDKGTIKQLLVRPYSRTKILLSKIIASIIAVLIFIIIYYILNTLTYVFIFDNANSIFDPIIVYDFNKSAVVEYSLFSYCLITFLSVFPIYLILFTFVIFTGVLTLNTTISTISGFALYFASVMCDAFLTEKMKAFIPVTCWDFSEYLFGGISSNQYSSLELSSLICIVTIVLLFVLSVLLFKNRDIKNQ